MKRCLLLSLLVGMLAAGTALAEPGLGTNAPESAALGQEAPIDPRAEEAFYVGNGLLADGNPAGALAAYMTRRSPSIRGSIGYTCTARVPSCC